MRPIVRASPLEVVRRLVWFLARRSLTESSVDDRTPICIGNNTDMFMSRMGIDYLLEYSNIHAKVLPNRPVCVVTKAKLQEGDLRRLDEIGHQVIIFLSQSFIQDSQLVQLERGPTSRPGDTARSLRLFRNLTNIVPIHFYRPVTSRTVPDAATAKRHLRLVQEAGALASVAVGLKHGPGLSIDEPGLSELIDRDTTSPMPEGELLEDRTRSDIEKAAYELGHPLYFNTSCAVALATGSPEALGTWRPPIRQLRCDPCHCPLPQRSRCDQARDRVTTPTGPEVAAVQRQVETEGACARWDEEAGAIRIEGAISQSSHNRLLHLLPFAVIADQVLAEEAWLGVFATTFRAR
jgi:hypothetical protein